VENAAAQMEKLVEARSSASARVRELEAQHRAAHEQLARARETLVSCESSGSTRASERRRLEQELAAAEALAGQPWRERISGAQRAVAAAQRAVQAHAGEHLEELLREPEREGDEVTAEINATAQHLADLHARWEGVARNISQLVSLVHRVSPGDATHSKSEAVAAECRRLVGEGGERAPRLRREVLPGAAEVA
jgi:hypothetical protein